MSCVPFSTPTAENVEEFQKLVVAGPLRQLHWVNIARHQVTLCTIRNDRKI
jgi:hypothetical protein